MSRIVVEGPIGVGKTSLARILAAEIDARLVLEVVEENPFLAPFYRDPARYAFNVQVFFLLSRFKQVRDLDQGALFTRHTVADYLFDKDWIFASLNLEGDEWELYQDLYQNLRPKLTTPDLVVYLRAGTDVLLERIARRGRPFELDMDETYLQRLSEAYDAYFAHYPHRLHVVEAADLDFVSRREDRDALLGDVLQLARVA